MENNIDGNISRLSNNYSLLKFEFEHFDEGRSKFASRDAILNLMLKNQNELRKLKEKKKYLTLKEEKNNSNE